MPTRQSTACRAALLTRRGGHRRARRGAGGDRAWKPRRARRDASDEDDPDGAASARQAGVTGSSPLTPTFPDVAQTAGVVLLEYPNGGHGLLAGLDSVVRRTLGQRATTTSRGSRAASLTGSPLTEVNVRDGGSRHPPSCLGAPRAHAARPRRPGVPSSDGPVPGRREDRAPVATRCRPGRSRRRRRAWPRR